MHIVKNTNLEFVSKFWGGKVLVNLAVTNEKEGFVKEVSIDST